jgi:hypothetical protein
MISKDNIPPQGHIMFFLVPCTDPLMADADGISGKTCIERHHKAENTDATADYGVDQSTIQTKNQYLIPGPKIYQIMFQDD